MQNRDHVFAYFSDPAGAKAVLGLLATNRHLFKSIYIASNRRYSFYNEFPFQVTIINGESSAVLSTLEQANLLIVGTSLPTGFELELILEAKKLEILSMALVDYPSNLKQRFAKTSSSVVYPNYIFVTCELARQLAIAAEIPAKTIYTIQNPYHSYLRSLYSQTMPGLSSFSDNLNTGNSNVVLYVPEPIQKYDLSSQYGFDELDGLDIICRALADIDSSHTMLVVKPHPNHDSRLKNKVNQIKDSASFPIHFIENESLVTLFLKSTLVIGFYSNAVVEADIVGCTIIRPLFMASPAKTDPLSGLVSHRCLVSYSYENFKRTICSFLS